MAPSLYAARCATAVSGLCGRDDADPVASYYAEPRQGVGQPVAQPSELPEGVLDDGIRRLVVVNQRRPGGSGRVPVADVGRDVVEPGGPPT